MKKVLLKSLWLLGLFLIPMVSCVDEHVTNINTWRFVKEYTIGPAGSGANYRWEHNETDDLYYCDIRVPDLTHDVYDSGILVGYLVYEVEGTWVDSPLPHSQFYISYGQQYEEQYTCEFSPGRITFLFKESNPIDAPAPFCTFVLKMMM